MKKNNLLPILLVLLFLTLVGTMTFLVMRTPDMRIVNAEHSVTAEPAPTKTSQDETLSTDSSDSEPATETASETAEPTTEAATEPVASAYDNKLVVTATQFLNIRETPDTASRVLGKIYHGSIAEIEDQQNNFSKITSGDVTGWISNDYVVFGAEAEEYIAKNGTYTATVNAKSLNVREKPNTTSRVLATVEQDQVFIVDEQQDGWVKIYYTTNIIGYLSTEYVIVNLSQGKAISVEEEKDLIGQIIPTEPETTKAPETKPQEKPKPTKPEATKPDASKPETTAPTETTAETTPAPTDNEVVVDDLQLLAALVQAEAGYNYEACLGVANVIINRKNSSSYPNTIRDVIYQKNQFSPVSSGYLDKILQNGPAKVAKEAAADALKGINNLDDTYYRFIGAGMADRDSYSKYQEIGGNVFYMK